ncbi:unnamed protein product [Prunus armeniaca]
MMLAKLGYAPEQYNPNFWILLHGVYIAWWLIGLGEPTFEQFMYLYSISKQHWSFGWVQDNCRMAKERGYFIGHKPSTQKSWRNKWCLAYGDWDCSPRKTVTKHIPTHFQFIDSTSSNHLLSFIDPYFDYNQIMVHETTKQGPLSSLKECPTQQSTQLSSKISWGHNICPDASQRLMKWAIELSQYNLFYRSKTAIKAQVLADFVIEFTPTAEEEKLVIKNKENSKVDDTSFADLDLPKDMWQLCAITLGLPTSNNEVEYEPLLAELRLAKELLIKKLAIYSNSQLITNQASGEYMAKHPRMVKYLDNVQELLKEFPTFTIQQIPRAKNTHVDALASLGLALDTQFKCSILIKHHYQPSIEEIEQVDSMRIDEDPSGQGTIINYLANGNLPMNRVRQSMVRYGKGKHTSKGMSNNTSTITGNNNNTGTNKSNTKH